MISNNDKRHPLNIQLKVMDVPDDDQSFLLGHGTTMLRIIEGERCIGYRQKDVGSVFLSKRGSNTHSTSVLLEVEKTIICQELQERGLFHSQL